MSFLLFSTALQASQYESKLKKQEESKIEREQKSSNDFKSSLEAERIRYAMRDVTIEEDNVYIFANDCYITTISCNNSLKLLKVYSSSPLSISEKAAISTAFYSFCFSIIDFPDKSFFLHEIEFSNFHFSREIKKFEYTNGTLTLVLN